MRFRIVILLVACFFIGCEEVKERPDLSDLYLTPEVTWRPELDHNDLDVRAAYTQLMLRNAVVELSKTIRRDPNEVK